MEKGPFIFVLSFHFCASHEIACLGQY